jgi:DNA-directed RNA polymerase specialized sigma24 family protein
MQTPRLPDVRARPRRLPAVKRSTGGRGAPADDLADFAGTEEAERVARLEADAELVDRLMWHGYAGSEWLRFAGVLAAYGVQVIRTWVLNGKIFVRCKRKGVRLNAGIRPSFDDAQELANETVARAIVSFRRKVLIPRKWAPAKGASLKTYFIGQCLFQFANVYRLWQNETHPLKPEDLLPEMLLPARADAFDVALLSAEIATFSARDPRAMAALHAAGYRYREIAAMLGTTAKGVETHQYRRRRAGAS